jgi:hypothetical protein
METSGSSEIILSIGLWLSYVVIIAVALHCARRCRSKLLAAPSLDASLIKRGSDPVLAADDRVAVLPSPRPLGDAAAGRYAALLPGVALFPARTRCGRSTDFGAYGQGGYKPCVIPLARYRAPAHDDPARSEYPQPDKVNHEQAHVRS